MPTTTTAVPPADHVIELIEEFLAAFKRNALEHHSSVVVEIAVASGAERGNTLRGWARSIGLGVGLVTAAAMITDKAYEAGLISRMSFARPAFALFAAAALAGRWGGSRAAWLAVLAAIPVMASFGWAGGSVPWLAHDAAWLFCLAIVAGCSSGGTLPLRAATSGTWPVAGWSRQRTDRVFAAARSAVFRWPRAAQPAG